MALNAGRILVAGDAHLWLGAVGSTMPTNATSALDTAWKEVGYFTDDSLQFNTDPAFTDITSHQSFLPTRTIQTGDAATLQVDLQEWSLLNLQASFGGGSVTTIAVTGPPSATHYKFSPPAVGARTETAAIVEVFDGTRHWRLCIPRSQQREGVEIPMNKGAEATLPLRLGILGGGIGDPYYWLTDDPAMAAS